MFRFISQGCIYSSCKNTQNFPYSKSIVLLTGAWLEWEWEADVLISLFTLLISPPFSYLFLILTARHSVQCVVIKGDNASWVEDIDFSFLLSRSLYSHPRWCFNVLSFSHLFLFFPYTSPAFIFDPTLSLSYLFFYLHCSLALSPYYTFYITLHPHTLFVFLVLSQTLVQW